MERERFVVVLNSQSCFLSLLKVTTLWHEGPVDPCLFVVFLSRRKPDASAWKAACVTTTTRSGSCCISSTLLYSSSSRKLPTKQKNKILQAFQHKRWTLLSYFFFISNLSPEVKIVYPSRHLCVNSLEDSDHLT